MTGDVTRRGILAGAGAVWVSGGVAERGEAQEAKESGRPAPVFSDAAGLPLIGRAFPNGARGWQRVNGDTYPDLPPVVKERLTHAAGLAVRFRTDSPEISARWCTADAAQNPNLTPIAQRGLDLYIRRGSAWLWAGVGKPGDGKACNEDRIVQNMGEGEKDCLLYLPLYKELKSLEIGVLPGASLRPAADSLAKRIAIYGSSIVQGASASRPGMAYPARLSRALDVEVINLGVSGVARMEPAAARMIADIDADAYVLDCVPNSSPEQITERAGPLVRTLRARRSHAPIIVVMSVLREAGLFDRVVARRVARQNAAMVAEMRKLADVPGLTVIPADALLGDDGEASIDGTHPNDIGFDRMLRVIAPIARQVLTRQEVIQG